ncbi:MAG TPA: N-acetyl-1-D-myo-inositol-2-amino-2-deoxy-alpha-D-glucopyranoside deacetylase [Candidatus Nanopelagicales bacterium]|nr:N-acetyl-1-D-myo-inositol-2-amino-2-deoxy-alpha-D-glucopyranoside deacetylase [Candidatus Nanopelagicales bacterium]
MTTTADRRLLLVHAHPDDEVIATGATMARYAAEGAHVTLVTCTLGEEGEILLPEIEHLAADRDDALGPHRAGELADAMRALGVGDQRQLGYPGKYRDSGMMGLPSNDRTGCFWRADLREAATDLVVVIREVRPQVLVSYDDFGGYGHPDHIQAHRVAMYASLLAAAPSYRPDLGSAWEVPKLYWAAMPTSYVRAGIQALRDAGDQSDFALMDPDDLPFTVPDELVTTTIDATAHVEAKVAAMRAHASQISLSGGFFALSNNLGSQVFGVEHFRRVRGPGPERESDLFDGVA